VGFLAEILPEVRRQIEAPTYLSEIEPARSAPSSLAGSVRTARSGALLVEYKRVSPGSDRPELPQRSVPEFARLTERAGVAGFSCLATGPRFNGSPRDVAALVLATRRPVLFKDFIIDPIQLDAAARAGASAVLLIARLETGGHLRTPLARLARMAHDRHLEVVLEFHDRTELSRAGDVAADMFGVNVRNLDTLAMEPEVAADTLRAASELRPLLGLSGIQSPDDALRFWSLGVDGILVGSAVARAEDPARFLRSLRRAEGGRPA